MQSVWMVVAALLFSLMGVAVKLASTQHNTWEIIAYRGLLGVAIIGAVIVVRARRGGPSVREALSSRHGATHARRSIAGTLSLTLWFVAIAGLPLATAMTINSSSPLFVGAWIAWLSHRHGERIDRTMSIALLCGFVGVVLLLRPTFDAGQWGYAVLGTVSTLFTAVAYLSVKALGQLGEPDTRIVFYFCAFNAIVGLVGAAIFGFHMPDARGCALLAAVGLTGTVAQLAVTRAFGFGGTLLSANLGYTGIVFSTAWGYLIFGDRLNPTSALGMTVIVVSSAVATLMTARALKRVASEPDETIVARPSAGVPDDASPRSS